MAEWQVRRAGAAGALLETGGASHGLSHGEGPGPDDAELSAPAGDGISQRAEPTSGAASPAPWPALLRARRVGWELIGLQLVAMVALSTVQYSRFALTNDFGAYAQAWWKIAHAQLDPWSTVLQASFWKNDAELVMWPLALLFHVYPHPVLLLWVQDLAVAATEIVALGWIVDVVSASGRDVPTRTRRGHRVGGGAVDDREPLGVADDRLRLPHRDGRHLLRDPRGPRPVGGEKPAPVVVGRPGPGLLGARRAESLRHRGVGCGGGAPVTTHRAGVGRGRARSLRGCGRAGAAGLGNRLVDTGYAYLAPAHHGHVGVLDMAVGALTHPGAVAHVAAPRGILFQFLVVAGLVGVVSPWGAGMALVVFVPSLLDSSPIFLRTAASFQSWPALPFVLVGSVMVVVRLSRWRGGHARRMGAGLLVVVSIPLAVVVGRGLSQADAWIAVSAPAAAQLSAAAARIPAGAEVIASQGVVGRFVTLPGRVPVPVPRPPTRHVADDVPRTKRHRRLRTDDAGDE